MYNAKVNMGMYLHRNGSSKYQKNMAVNQCNE